MADVTVDRSNISGGNSDIERSDILVPLDQIKDALDDIIEGNYVFEALTVDTNTLHVDAANNRVGINTTSPSHSLHVVSSGDMVGIDASGLAGSANAVFKRDAGQFARLKFLTASSNRWWMGVSDDAEAGANAGSHFFLNAYDDLGTFLRRAIQINRNDGFVAIGRTTALAGLHVEGTLRFKLAHSTPASMPTDQGEFWTDEGSSEVKFTFRTSGGVTKTSIIGTYV